MVPRVFPKIQVSFGATWRQPFLFDTGSNLLTVGCAPEAPRIRTHTVTTGTPEFIVHGGGSGTALARRRR